MHSSLRALTAALARASTHTARPTTARRLPAGFLRQLATEAAEMKKPPFDKILIANRGEIAVRVMKTAQRLGIKCVAVYSEADKNSMHVQMADEAYCIGPAPSSESYLRMDKIVEVAKKTGAQAIHPGYGFLSESAEFATYLEKHGLVFIGPPASAITSMGSKSESKKIMQAAEVPVVPGYHGDNQDPAFLKEQCGKIGYPVLIKAVMGGGGKGMRIVNSEAEFDEMLASAKREAIKSFGDDRVLVEKYLTRPRHVEVQVFADKHGNAVYLFERDCSVQRRHQKIIEEAPAPDLSEELRKQLGEKAVAAAKAVNYVGAGTVEFILDATTKTFAFMEMNTRLQVEHPVSEMITQTDLVEWQLQVAAGNKLPKLQDDLKIHGWSFEARIYAENPQNQFLPDTGPLVHLATPEVTDTVRVETGVRQGDQVSVFYDPMIAKLVVHGPDRASALAKLGHALDQYQVVGLNTNIEFLKALAKHPEFVKANVETGFIAKYGQDLLVPIERPAPDAVMLAAVALLLGKESVAVADPVTASGPWGSLPSARLNHAREQAIELQFSDEVTAKVTAVHARDVVNVTVAVPGVEDVTYTINAKSVRADAARDRTVFVDLGDRQVSATVVLEGDMVHVFANGTGVGRPHMGAVKHSFTVPEPAYLAEAHAQDEGKGGNAVKTPMPCKISQVHVKPGDKVTKGQPLVVLEAMKMEHVMRSPVDGVIARVHYKVGDLVEENKLLLAFEETAEEAAEKAKE
ncbi:Methylcrotonoyl-CoA carboxylase subunit alpha, mitochondrial [Allomyces arbusculus]|nr:Methylcrotonoyl-CoA carboxylase subunit alpha, mitochondrial [Allomyces arbusculus]